MLAASVIALGVAVTITAGTWIGGVPTFVRDTLHHGAGGFSIVMAGYAAGSIVAGVFLARVRIRRKARAAMLAWSMYLPGYGLLALAGSLPLAVAGAFFAATGQSSSVVLVNSAAQEQVPDSVLGRVLGVDLAHPSRRARDRAPARLSSLRVRRAHAQCSARRRSPCRSSGSSRSPARRS